MSLGGVVGQAPTLVEKDEEAFTRPVSFESLSKLKPCFKPVEGSSGSVTAGNASPISDGAAALVLISREKAVELGLTKNIIAVVRGFDDAAHVNFHFIKTVILFLP